MTITFKSQTGITIGKINSTVPADIVKTSAKSWANSCYAIFVSCADKPDAVSKAKASLLAMAKAEKFKQTEVTEVESKFAGSVSFVMNRVPLEAKDDNSDLALSLITGA